MELLSEKGIVWKTLAVEPANRILTCLDLYGDFVIDVSNIVNIFCDIHRINYFIQLKTERRDTQNSAWYFCKLIKYDQELR